MWRIALSGGVAIGVARRMGQKAQAEGALQRIVAEAVPDVLKPSVRAVRDAAFLPVRMDDLLAREDVRIGVGAQHARAILRTARSQGDQGVVIDLVSSNLAGSQDGDFDIAVVERVLHRDFGEIDVGRRLPGCGDAGQ